MIFLDGSAAVCVILSCLEIIPLSFQSFFEQTSRWTEGFPNQIWLGKPKHSGSFDVEVFLDKLQTWAICLGIKSLRTVGQLSQKTADLCCVIAVL